MASASPRTKARIVRSLGYAYLLLVIVAAYVLSDTGSLLAATIIGVSAGFVLALTFSYQPKPAPVRLETRLRLVAPDEAQIPAQRAAEVPYRDHGYVVVEPHQSAAQVLGGK